MHIIKDDDPLLRSRRPFDPNRVAGGEITCGNIAKIVDGLAESRDTMAKLAADLGAKIADLSARIASVEAEAKAAIAGAGGETLVQRLARLNPR